MNTNTLNSIKGFETGLLSVICHNLSLCFFFFKESKTLKLPAFKVKLNLHTRDKGHLRGQNEKQTFFYIVGSLLSADYLLTNFE